METKDMKLSRLQNMEHFQFASHVAALCDEANIELVNAVLEPLKQAIEQEDKALNLPRQEEGTKELEQLDRARDQAYRALQLLTELHLQDDDSATQAAAQRISEVLSRYPKVIQSEYDKESGMIKNLLTDLKAPASNAFTGLVTDGQEGNVYAGTINTSGDWDMGWNFNNKITNPDATVFFPALGCRLYYNGELVYVGSVGYHWAATPYDSEDGYYMFLDKRRVVPHVANTYADGLAVRPVADE